jgi:FdhD protein
VKVKSFHIERIKDGHSSFSDDLVVVEEPLEILVETHDDYGAKDHKLSVTMRTPGNDEELAAGFVCSESIVSQAEHIHQVAPCRKAENTVRVSLQKGINIPDTKLNRNFFTASSCGICGKDSIDSVNLHCKPFHRASPLPEKEILLALPDKAGDDQTVFRFTGGLHACSLFTLDGELIRIREDVGRHNALDKLIGSFIIEKSALPQDVILLLSGRAGFEMIQKAAMAGWNTVCSIGAPSSLAVELAVSLNMNLVGFLRKNSFNVYHRSGERI